MSEKSAPVKLGYAKSLSECRGEPRGDRFPLCECRDEARGDNKLPAELCELRDNARAGAAGGFNDGAVAWRADPACGMTGLPTGAVFAAAGLAAALPFLLPPKSPIRLAVTARPPAA